MTDDWLDWAPEPDDAEPTVGIGAAASFTGRSAGPVNWRTLRPADADTAWLALRGWVDWFRTRFGFDHRVVPPCWYRHPALVDLLSALHDHWRDAYQPASPRSAASDWHRVLIQLEPRLRDCAGRTGCTPFEHRPDTLADYPDDTDAWQQHLTADRADRERHAIPAQPF